MCLVSCVENYLQFNDFANLLFPDYKLSVRTGRGLSAGTDASFSIEIAGSYGENLKIKIDGKGRALDSDR